MNLLFLALFSIIPIFAFCDDQDPSVQLGSSPPKINKGYFTFLMVITIILMIYFAISFIASCCCCEPEYSSDPDCVPSAVHIISGVVIFLSCILIYTGVSKVTIPEYGYKSKRNSHFDEITAIIQNPFQQNVKTITQIYENISKSDYNSETLQKSAIDYNSIFIDENGDYRKSFNDLYLKPNVATYLKYSLKSMDDSLNGFLSDLFIFIDKYNDFSEKVKNTLKSINLIYVASAEEANRNLEKRLSSLVDELNELKKQKSQLGAQSYNDSIIIEFGYITATGALVLAIIYCILFFFTNCCSRCCFCSYGLWAFLVLGSCFVSGFITFEDSYSSLTRWLNNFKATRFETEIKEEIEKALFEATSSIQKFTVDIEVNDYFDPQFIDNLYGRMNSKSVHLNYTSVFTYFAPEPSYRADLVEMVQIIKGKTKNLNTMKELFEGITDFSFTIVPTLKKLQNSVIPSIENNESVENMIEIVSKSLGADNVIEKLVTGYNCILVGVTLLCIGLLAMSITVCLRRPDMSDYSGVSNSQRSSNNSSGMKAYYYGKHTVYFMAYPDPVNQVDLSGIFQNGRWGSGIYFTDSSGDAFAEFYANTDKSTIIIQNLRCFECTVDFGRILEVPSGCYSQYKFPDSLNQNNCVSVMGHNPNGITEYVIFDFSRCTIDTYYTVNPEKLRNYMNQYK